jgi:transposase InsO family protein
MNAAAGQGSVDMARESLHAVERVRGSGLGKGSAIKRPDAEIILSADPFLDMPCQTKRPCSNHADGIASMDMFVVPTASFRLLYGLLILQHARRELVWLSVTAHPNAQWIAQQLTEAYGWREAPKYLIRDRDSAYGETFIRRGRSMGIRDRPTSARSPWQNGYAERLIGSVRRDCLDHVIVFGERHLRYLLASYQRYYNEARTHLSLRKDSPVPRQAQAVGRLISVPILGGLHHQYVRA